MKNIYEERSKNNNNNNTTSIYNNNKSLSKSTKYVNDYTSSESNENLHKNNLQNFTKSEKSEIKSSIITNKNKEYSNLKINEVTLSHKKPIFQHNIFNKFKNGEMGNKENSLNNSIGMKNGQDNMKTNDKSQLNSEDGVGSEVGNLKVIKFESIKSSSMDSGEIIRKFSDNYHQNNNKNANDLRSSSLTKSFKKTMRNQEEQEIIKKIDIDSLIKIDYVKSFSTIEFLDLKFEYQIYEADICVVYKGKYKALAVAIKIYNLSKLCEENLKSFNYEINLLMSLRHPNIVTFIGYCHNKNNFYLITEFMEKKSLKNVLDQKKIELTLTDKLNMCLDISLAIFYLHTRNPLVLHRDLKSSNCLVNKNNKVKLCDFGLSKIYENAERQTNSSSTCFWMAPEFIVEKIFNDKSDIYSLGILFWEIFMRDTIPYKGMNELTFLLGDLEILKKRPIIPENFDKDLRRLIEECWRMDYNQRPTISEVVEKVEDLINKKSMI